MTDMETIHVFWQVGTRSIGGMLNAMNRAVLNMSYVKLKGIEYKISIIKILKMYANKINMKKFIFSWKGCEIPAVGLVPFQLISIGQTDRCP
jgi:hypothetical protein